MLEAEAETGSSAAAIVAAAAVGCLPQGVHSSLQLDEAVAS